MPQFSGDQIASLSYLILLAVVLGGYVLVANRRNLSRMARHSALWLFIFLGAIVAAGLWSDLRDDVAPRQTALMDAAGIEVPRSPDGHFYLTLDVNGAPIRFVIDTGASEVVLTLEDATRAGIDTASLIYSGRAFTANGMVETAPVRLDTVSFGAMEDTGLRAVVNRGEMRESLLGMRYLERFGRLEISGNRLLLER